MRGYLAAEVVALLKFKGNVAWADAIARETDQDRGPIRLDGRKVSLPRARRSVEVVAKTLVQTKTQALENHALGEIQNWRDTDEAKVKRVRHALRSGKPLPATSGAAKIYAAHLVAGAVIEACATGTDIPLLQSRMIDLLNAAHHENAAPSPAVELPHSEIERHYFIKAAWRKTR